MTFKLLLSTAVWGEDYLEIFLEYTLRSLLTNNNLLNKEISKQSKYIIYAESKYIDSIKNHNNFKKLKKIIKVTFIDLKLDGGDEKYSNLKNYQNLSIKYGYQNKYDLFTFIYPDSVFGENHFKTLFSKIKKGYKVVMCTGPLGVYEKFFEVFKDKKINNVNLSDFILHNLHPFYKLFLNDRINNWVQITEDKEKSYQFYQCFDLHPAIISFSIKNLKIENTFDADILNNKNINLSNIGYLNHSSEGIIITLESIFSDRGMISEDKNLNDFSHNEYNDSNIFDIIKYSDNKKLSFNISHHLKGGFIVSKKNNKNFSSLLNTNPKKIKMLEKIMKNNSFKVINKINIIDEFLNFKKNNLKFKNIYGPTYENVLREIERQSLNLNRFTENQILHLINQNLKLKKEDGLYQINLRRIALIKAEQQFYSPLLATNAMKLTILSIIILTLRFMPKIIKNLFLYIKQKNRSNKYLNKNIPLIRSLLMLPNSGLIKVVISRINK